jgi:hypothetical protein
MGLPWALRDEKLKFLCQLKMMDLPLTTHRDTRQVNIRKKRFIGEMALSSDFLRQAKY